jgi:hypothetical protein
MVGETAADYLSVKLFCQDAHFCLPNTDNGKLEPAIILKSSSAPF